MESLFSIQVDQFLCFNPKSPDVVTSERIALAGGKQYLTQSSILKEIEELL